jgi:ankyrin repeat protein
VNSRNNIGNTPLNTASKNGYQEVVNFLRQHGGR